VLESLRHHFQVLCRVVLVLNVLMMLAGLMVRRWNLLGLVEYGCIWAFLLTWSWSLGWRWARVLPVMWASLNCARPAYAVWRASGFNGWSWWWILFNLRHVGRGFRNFPSGSVPELVFVVFFAVLWLAVWLGKHYAGGTYSMRNLRWNPQTWSWVPRIPTRDRATAQCEGRLVSEFREIVREPLPEATDPRFKQWNPAERFPWGWGLIPQQLHERLVRRKAQDVLC
jgi:hypothetical protein